METIIVYVDDAQYALPLLETASRAPTATNTHWILVACAPRITHRVSKFVSNRAREHWRNKWAERLFAECVPLLQSTGARVTANLAKGPLPEVLADLQQVHGPHAQVVDLRRPKLAEHQPAPALATQRPLHRLACMLTGVSAVWTVCVSEVLAA